MVYNIHNILFIAQTEELPYVGMNGTVLDYLSNKDSFEVVGEIDNNIPNLSRGDYFMTNDEKLFLIKDILHKIISQSQSETVLIVKQF